MTRGIDVHHHFLPRFLLRETSGTQGLVGDRPPPPWDTALSFRDPALLLLRAVVGLERLLFATDFPYQRGDLAVNCSPRLEGSSELTVEERTAVMSGNAITLFPRLGH